MCGRVPACELVSASPRPDTEAVDVLFVGHAVGELAGAVSGEDAKPADGFRSLDATSTISAVVITAGGGGDAGDSIGAADDDEDDAAAEEDDPTF